MTALSPLQRKIVAQLRRKPGQSAKELARTLGSTEQSVEVSIKRIRAAGLAIINGYALKVEEASA